MKKNNTIRDVAMLLKKRIYLIPIFILLIAPFALANYQMYDYPENVLLNDSADNTPTATTWGWSAGLVTYSSSAQINTSHGSNGIAFSSTNGWWNLSDPDVMANWSAPQGGNYSIKFLLNITTVTAGAAPFIFGLSLNSSTGSECTLASDTDSACWGWTNSGKWRNYNSLGFGDTLTNITTGVRTITIEVINWGTSVTLYDNDVNVSTAVMSSVTGSPNFHIYATSSNLYAKIDDIRFYVGNYSEEPPAPTDNPPNITGYTTTYVSPVNGSTQFEFNITVTDSESSVINISYNVTSESYNFSGSLLNQTPNSTYNLFNVTIDTSGNYTTVVNVTDGVNYVGLVNVSEILVTALPPKPSVFYIDFSQIGNVLLFIAILILSVYLTFTGMRNGNYPIQTLGALTILVCGFVLAKSGFNMWLSTIMMFVGFVLAVLKTER